MFYLTPVLWIRIRLDPEFFFRSGSGIICFCYDKNEKKKKINNTIFYFLFVPVPKFFCIVSINALPSWLNLLLHRFYKFTTLVNIIAVESGTQKKIVSGNEINHSGFTTPPKTVNGNMKEKPLQSLSTGRILIRLRAGSGSLSGDRMVFSPPPLSNSVFGKAAVYKIQSTKCVLLLLYLSISLFSVNFCCI